MFEFNINIIVLEYYYQWVMTCKLSRGKVMITSSGKTKLLMNTSDANEM